METLLQDLRYALRSLLRSPGFSAVAIGVLALGIGGTTATFGVVNGVLLRPLPFRDPDRLVVAWNRFPQPGLERVTLAPAEYADLVAGTRLAGEWAALSYREANLTGGGEPVHLAALDVTPGFFRLLGVDAALGRTFAEEEGRTGSDAVVVLSHELWAGRFGSDPRVVGRTVSLDGRPVTVVGVMPRGFGIPNPEGFLLPRHPQLWTPLALDALAGESRGSKFLRVMGRLRPGAEPERARAEMDALSRGIRARYPGEYPEGWGLALSSLHEQTVGGVRPALFLLLATVALVLAMACVNVANLVLARSVARRRELAVRSALGASRRRVVRQLATECLLLAGAGGAAGALLAAWAVETLAGLGSPAVPRLAEVAIDGRVLAFALAATLATGLLLGVLPALQATAGGPYEALREGGRGATGGGRRLRGVLVAGEIALALVVLAGTGLMLNSLVRLVAADPGFDPEGVLTTELTLPASAYPDGAARAALYDAAVERVRALPGVRAAAVVNPLPLSGNLWEADFVVEGRVPAPGEPSPNAEYASVSPGYFEAMGIRLLRGRAFGAGDRAGGPEVAIVNETLARESWPGRDPVGRRIHLGGQADSAWATVVGVVAATAAVRLDAPPRPQVYLPHAQRPRSSAHLVVRAAGDPLGLVGPVRRAVRELDPALPLGNARSMERVLAESLAERRLVTLLLAGFGAVALLLASLGLYGLVAYAVSHRTREIGVRVALGARRADVLRMVVREGMAPALAGIAAGAAAAGALAGALSGLVYGVSATDPATLLGVAALLAAVALLACLVPARRAMRVDPMVAMRAE